MSGSMRGILFALVAFALYALHDVVIKFLGDYYAPFQTVFFTVLFSFPLAMLMLMRDGKPGHLRPVHPWWVGLRTAAAVGAAASAFYAFSVLPLGDTYAILFSAPLIITLLAIPVLGEKVRLRRGLAVVVGLIGVAIVVRPGQAAMNLGHLAALSAAFCSGLASIIVRRIGKDERDIVLLLYPLIGNFVVMGALLPLVYIPMPLAHLGGMALIALLGSVAMLCSIAAYKAAEAALVAPMQYSQILWATLYGISIFDETPDWMTLFGSSIIIASGLYIVFRETRSGVSARTPVLRNRSRAATPGTLRIGPLMRMRGLRR